MPENGESNAKKSNNNKDDPKDDKPLKGIWLTFL